MTILESLQRTVVAIKSWVDLKFVRNENIDSQLSAVSTNPIQNKAITAEVDNLKTLIGEIDVSEQISSAINDIDYPVDSVNGKTGHVVLNASDVGALPFDTNIPSIDGLATETYVDAKVADLVDSAPETLNTLNELSSALGDDPNFATTIATQIGHIETKVGDTSVSDQIQSAIDCLTADNVGIYVQPNEPLDAVDGDIWIDTANDPSIIPEDYPDVLPNPHAITFSGAANGSYDGSEVVNIDIPLVPTKVSDLDNDIGFITSYTETDPTVPSWAKELNKPSYTKSEVGLGSVDNIRQYSANNPPPYPVTSVNGKTGSITINELPAVTTADNGKVLMVVNGAWKVVDLNMSVDANGIVSI